MTTTSENNAPQASEHSDSPRQTWTMPTLRALSASMAELNPIIAADGEGTS